MASKRIKDLPLVTSAFPDDVLALDGATTRSITPTDLVDSGRPFADQPTAEAGVSSTTAMSPLTTAQAIAAQLPSTEAGKALLAADTEAEQRNLLGIGGAGILNIGTTEGTVAAGDDARFLGVAGIADQATAEAGVDNSEVMSPLRTAQAVTVQAEEADFTPAAPAAVKRRLQDKGRDIISPRDFGVVSGTDESIAAANTTKMQAFIDELCSSFDETNGYGAAVGDLGHGCQYILDALEITKPIALRGGTGAEGTQLRQRASVSESLLQVRMAYDSYDYYTLQSRPAQLVLENIKLIGGDQLASQPNQHGIDLQNASSSALTTRVVLSNVDIQRFAGAGLFGQSFSGWVDGWGVNCHNNTVAGLSANTCFDWRLSQSNFFANTGYGELLSGCGYFAHALCNQWSNLDIGVLVFNADNGGQVNHVWDLGTTDRNRHHGFRFDMRGAYQVCHITDRQILLNSNQNAGLYDEISMTTNCVGTVFVDGGTIGHTEAQAISAGTSDGYSRYHVGYEGSGGLVVFSPSVFFRGDALVESTVRSLQTAEAGFRTKRSLTVDGNAVIGTSASAAARNLSILAAAGQTRSVGWYSGTAQRWRAQASSVAESGANAGSDFAIDRFDDAGGYLGSPISINRATGVVSMTTGASLGVQLRPTGDVTINVGSPALRFAAGYMRDLRPGTGTVLWTAGSGSPEGVVTAPVGSLFTRTDGGASTTVYVKETGSGNTGWVAK